MSLFLWYFFYCAWYGRGEISCEHKICILAYPGPGPNPDPNPSPNPGPNPDPDPNPNHLLIISFFYPCRPGGTGKRKSVGWGDEEKDGEGDDVEDGSEKEEEEVDDEDDYEDDEGTHSAAFSLLCLDDY